MAGRNYIFSDKGNFKFWVENGILKATYTIGRTYDNFTSFDPNIVVPDTVVGLSKSAFAGLPPMESITLPSSIKTIASGAFGHFQGKIFLPDDFPAAVSINGVIYSADMKVLLKATADANGTDIIVPDGVTEISDNAFEGIDCKSVSLPESLVKIGAYAFGNYFNCDSHVLENSASYHVHIPKNVRRIGKGAFQTFRVGEITVSEENNYFKTIDGVLFTKNGKKLLHCPSMKTDSFAIPTGTEQIAEFAFAMCSLSEIIIPGFLKNNMQGGWFNFSKLKKAIIEDGVTTIPDYAFFACEVMTEIVIPQSVTFIGTAAFDRTKKNIRIVAPAGSYAMKIAEERGFKYKEI